METELKIGRYANILMDRWFKRTFGREQAKRLMQLFLQTLIPDREIAEISYEAQEHVNASDADGKDIRLDVQCRDSNGNLFIVEVQLLPQDTFYERAVYNSALVIQEQVPSGARDWDFAPVYFIGVLNFSLHKDTDQVLFRYRLREDTTLDSMTDRIQYLFLEVPNCSKALTNDAQPLDNLCYALGNIAELEDRPPQMEGELFDLLFNSAEIRNFAPRERNEYISEMETERDRINQLAYAEKKGMEKGMERERQSTISRLLAYGMLPEEIAKALNVTLEEISAAQ
ncbi:MAG: Rpn family recombination-promoting nuclease/putative transposase [Bacteroidales bacterium]|nr:Rpn family recombination-promoting nuclease/putative transposase [Bacteroidales bacterium]